jgi:hypothetical protein
VYKTVCWLLFYAMLSLSSLRNGINPESGAKTMAKESKQQDICSANTVPK